MPLIEPGGFLTDWAGTSITVHYVRDAYLSTVVVRVEALERGLPILFDPKKAAQAILTISDVPEPPLWLVHDELPLSEVTDSLTFVPSRPFFPGAPVWPGAPVLPVAPVWPFSAAIAPCERRFRPI